MLTPVSYLLSTPPPVRTKPPVTMSHKMSTQGQVTVAQVLDMDKETFAAFAASNSDDVGTFLADNITDCHTAPLSLKLELWARLRWV